ncbi:MAG TPA: hypothetical protein VMB71_01395, partial [Acetobacteraceae bacterium]|nr:hypothetical protein [Acetobacteraceae bacterium]
DASAPLPLSKPGLRRGTARRAVRKNTRAAAHGSILIEIPSGLSFCTNRYETQVGVWTDEIKAPI